MKMIAYTRVGIGSSHLFRHPHNGSRQAIIGGLLFSRDTHALYSSLPWLGFNVSYNGIYLSSIFDSNGYVKLECINVVFLIRNHKEFIAYFTIKEDQSATKIIGFTIQTEEISTHPPVPSDSVH